MKKLISAILLLLFASLSIFSEDISFSGGYTRMRMQEGFETITLGDSAEVTVGSLKLTSDEMVLSGKDFRYVSCTGNVTVTDPERGISLITKSLFFDRMEELIIVDSWVELQDTTNEVASSSGRLEFNLKKGVVLLQIQVRLLKHTDDGAMVCRADSIQFDRDKELLELRGNATIVWNPDTYEAQTINVNLQTEEIKMDGSIKGTIHG